METTRPAIALIIGDSAAQTPRCSAIGGPAWRPDSSVNWPMDRRGIVMMHLARIDFSELPLLDGFPRSGLLQIFISTQSITLGAGEAHGKGFIVEYWPNPDEGIAVPQPELIEGLDEGTPLVAGTPEETMHDDGRSLGFEQVQMEKDEDGEFLPEAWIGGWPFSVQNSQQGAEGVVLLQIGNGECGDNEFIWEGDIGAATFLISPKDLSAKRFDQVVYDAAGC